MTPIPTAPPASAASRVRGREENEVVDGLVDSDGERPSRQDGGLPREKAHRAEEPRPLSIERESSGSGGTPRADASDDGEDDIELTLEDVADLFTLNDFSVQDTEWLKSFAREIDALPGHSIGRHLFFCIEFDDLLTSPSFHHFLKADGTPAVFLYLTEVAGAPTLTVSAILQRLVDTLGVASENMLVAVPAVSIYGGKMTCVARIHGQALPSGYAERLRQMQAELGQKHMRWGECLASVLKGVSP